MGVFPDWMIRKMDIVTPFAEAKKRRDTISYGVTSYGYDLRAGYKFKIFTNVYGSVIDPKAFDNKMLVDVDLSEYEYQSAAGCDSCVDNKATVVIPPNSFALAETLETINVPRGCVGIVIGKSTYARCGLIVNVTPLEPEWRGKITMELSNTAQLPLRVYAGEGIAQVLFIETAGLTHGLIDTLSNAKLAEMMRMKLDCEQSYNDKGGKYQDQAGLTTPKVD